MRNSAKGSRAQSAAAGQEWPGQAECHGRRPVQTTHTHTCSMTRDKQGSGSGSPHRPPHRGDEARAPQDKACCNWDPRGLGARPNPRQADGGKPSGKSEVFPKVASSPPPLHAGISALTQSLRFKVHSTLERQAICGQSRPRKTKVRNQSCPEVSVSKNAWPWTERRSLLHSETASDSRNVPELRRVA